MSFKDRTLTCQDCGNAFTYSAEEQEFHAQKGYTNEPKRCPDCRRLRRANREYGGSSGSSGYRGYGSRREMYPVVCAQCGVETTVPFQPRGDRPVYCSECYGKQASRPRSR